MTSLRIRQPDDWHIHLRDGEALYETCQSVSRYFARAIIMPNLKPANTTVEEALAYRERILNAVPQGRNFQPLMTLYLTENTTVEEIIKAANHPNIHACKLYPAGATTNSDAGVKNINNILPVLAAMEEHALPLLVHGEVTDDSTDIFDREKLFIDQVFRPLISKFPKLRVVFEHITTKDAVDFVLQSSNTIAATITVHHLLFNRNHMLSGGIRPHYYCLPILKKNSHQQALIAAATSGNPKFFLGTDSAPHAQNQKESACGCAGAYTAPAAIELYARVFEEANALNMLEGFASQYGADFYQLPLNEKFITLIKSNWTMPNSFDFADQTVIPIFAGENISWKAQLL
jgi:dihydroorotase